ncbi:hypothetical protein [Embleya hyalina]|uniref:hypothetical protein n=1 Tax=Embleya hyalina TaxID=516124 RepID=UPI00135B1A65|nr:hypothetical protein [Embleya hyalina]
MLTAIAVNFERLGDRPADEDTSPPRPPTAFQIFPDQNDIPRPKPWRDLGT